MKNIHLIPTENYSPLVHSANKYGGLFRSVHYSPMREMGDSYQNIYITSDEEIKEGDWCINLNSPYEHKELCRIDNQIELERYVQKTENDCKKIILTTDEQLIIDGVQPIDDEFLEWFVKNPSCEEVRVNDWLDINGNIAFGGERYQICNHLHSKIIIPQEEHSNQIKCYCGHTSYCDCSPLEEPKQEENEIIDISDHDGIGNAVDNLNNEPPQETTIEEAAKEFVLSHDFSQLTNPNHLANRCFQYGAKWQQERSYSEEEVENIITKLMHEVHTGDVCYGNNVIDFKISPRKWFEQFKKK